MPLTPSAVFPAGMQVLERGWLSSNNILFTAGPHTLLVDSGYCTHAAQTLALVEDLLADRPLDILVNTHLHSDHCGGNAALQSRYRDLRTLIPPGQAQQVADWDPESLTYAPTGQLCPRFNFTAILRPGTDMLFGGSMWQVHAAPGHDPHSLVFFEPERRLLISADALWENGFGVVFPELEGAQAFDEVGATLEVIERLQPELVIPGHGAPFAYSRAILSRATQRLEAFVKNPLKHARHAAKVLLKFKLLEVQRLPRDDFERWARHTSYLVQIQKRFFETEALSPWITALCDELIRAGVAGEEAGTLFNL